ncbi:type II toxin-antitoxin system VapC family toxin [Candidatus Woesearchaeota archaeon]|nr:type II toxin-antitoxin system VapC family toxin [Candidatus Woesearchaeota archaeon]
MSFVVDSDLFIDFLRSYPPSKDWFDKLDWEQAYFSAISEGELLSGQECTDDNARRKTLELLQAATKVLVTNEIAQKAGEVRRNYGIPIMDAFIAATALDLGCILLTRNIKHYQHIPGLTVKKPY